MPAAFPRIAEPIQVGSVTLPNRMIMGSMHTGHEGYPERFETLARFYADRAKGGAALVVTGGFAPNPEGRMMDHPCYLHSADQVAAHRQIPDAVHAEGGRILLQLLHAGRYGYQPDIVAPSPIKSPINRDIPRELSGEAVWQTVRDYASAAGLAREAGYDGVEIMGSEGYLISQFLAERTNHRTDEWGGDHAARMRFPVEVVKAVREALGSDGILSYRISAQELIHDGLDQAQTQELAQAIETAGADCISTGIGWHESPVPTIAGIVPHAAFAGAAAKIREAVSIPVIASNRINLPETAEQVLADGLADMVSMARPYLADPEFVNKAVNGKADLINVCIACNQACLDHYFTGAPVSCLVNPRAAQELEFDDTPAGNKKSVAVVGAGVAGIACALEAARRGHAVTLHDGAGQIGGQLRLAAVVPGKEDYALAIDGFERQLEDLGVKTVLGASVDAEALAGAGHDEVVIATGVTPRKLDIPGADDPRVAGYTDILDGTVTAGDRVLVIGGGGIGHDVALFLTHPEPESEDTARLNEFQTHWGIGRDRNPPPARRAVTMLKRSPGGFGKTLGKSTGWILREELRDFGVRQLAEVTYEKIDPDGLHISIDGKPEVLDADTIVICAGQESNAGLAAELEGRGVSVQVIGGARLAGELDAKRAIDEGARVGNSL